MIIIFIGLSMMGTVSILEVLTGKFPNFANILIGFIVGLIVMAIGYIIALIGTLASFMKFLTELIEEDGCEFGTRTRETSLAR